MSVVFDCLTMLATTALYFLGGQIFFLKWLFRNYECHNNKIKFIFALAFTLSCTMFQLIIFEIAGVLEPNSRRLAWRLSFHLMLFLIVGVIPGYVSLLLSTLKFPNAGYPLSLCFYGLFLFAFWKIGDPFPISLRWFFLVGTFLWTMAKIVWKWSGNIPNTSPSYWEASGAA